MTSSKRNLWPLGIVITLVIFAGFIVTIAIYISGKNVDLESKDYYLQSVEYSDIIDMKNAFEGLDEKPSFNTQETGKLTINFPSSYWSKVDSGKVSFYKPDNASLDFESKFNKPMASSFSILTDKRKVGTWKIKFTFSMNNMIFYTEKDVTLH